jgi:hypothetical protein
LFASQPSEVAEDAEATRLFESNPQGSADLNGAATDTSDEEETRLVDSEVSNPSLQPVPQSAARPAVPPEQPLLTSANPESAAVEIVPPLASLGPTPTFDTQSRTGLGSAGRGGWGLYLFFASTTLLLVLTAIFFFRRELFELGVQKTREAFGMKTETPVALGPPFDTQAAGESLAKIARKVEKCRETGGPTGAGRVRVLFQPTGAATSAAVSKPFHQTKVGDCLVELFKTAKVPAFGGQPVIVTKSFQLP